MIDAGAMLILFALALMMVSPIHVTITRPSASASRIAPTLRGSVTPAAAACDLGELIRLADDALAPDPLIRATAETYDQT